MSPTAGIPNSSRSRPEEPPPSCIASPRITRASGMASATPLAIRGAPPPPPEMMTVGPVNDSLLLMIHFLQNYHHIVSFLDIIAIYFGNILLTIMLITDTILVNE